MTVPNSFSANTTAQSSPVNANFTDIATELTNSLPRDGQASMTGQLKASSGTAAAPGISFGSDTNTGFFRKSGDVMGISAAGSEIGTLSASGLTISAVTDTDGSVYDAFATGTKMLFQQTAAPTGWTKDVTHDDKALRIVSGTASSGGSVVFSTVFGLTATDSHTLTTTQIPSHTHDPGTLRTDSHTALQAGSTTTTEGGSGQTIPDLSNWSHDHFVTSGVTGSAGGDAGHTHDIDLQVAYVDVIIATKD